VNCGMESRAARRAGSILDVACATRTLRSASLADLLDQHAAGRMALR
jgi:hypothetical protein